MTVALFGVGADSTNSDPFPRIYANGTFEYVPIPEAQESKGAYTYGELARFPKRGHLVEADSSEETLATVLDEISPQESAGTAYIGEDIAVHPVHHDPNFRRLTYGEVKTRNRNQILELDPEQDDLLAFYTGLASEHSSRAYRYVVGYFSVEEIIDLKRLLPKNPPLVDDERVVVSDLPADSRETIESILEAHPHNAHVKRYRASGTIHKELLLVAGAEPGGLLDEPYPISQTVPGGYAFTRELEERFTVRTTRQNRETGFLGGYKLAHRLGISGTAFIEIVTRPA